MKQAYKEAFTEVNEIINLMPKELVNKIPNSFIEILQEEKDNEYEPNIQEPLENQKLKDETIVILGLIYRDFLCDIEERKKLQEKDAKELEEIKQEIENEMLQKYNPNDIFKNVNNTYSTQPVEKSLMVIKEEKWYKKIFNIIKRIFEKNND